MRFLVRINVLIDCVLHVLYRVADAAARVTDTIVRRGCGISGNVRGRCMRGVLDVTPGLATGALDLITQTLVGSLVITDSFTNCLLGLADNLFKLAFYLVRIHISPFTEALLEACAIPWSPLSETRCTGLDYCSSTAANKLQQKHYERNDEKNVDIPCHYVEADEADEPEHEQDDEDSPKHLSNSPFESDSKSTLWYGAQSST
jgi:hypothetical protein